MNIKDKKIMFEIMDELATFYLAKYFRSVIIALLQNYEKVEEMPPIMEFKMPKRGIKVVVKIEKMEGDEE